MSFGAALVLAAVYLKYSFLLAEPAVLVVRLLPGAQWNLPNIGSLFVWDVLLCAGVIPAIFLVVGLGMGRHRRSGFVAASLLLVLAAVVANVTYHTSARFPSPGLLSEAFEAWWADPAAMDPLGLMSLGKLLRTVVLFAAVVVAGIASARLHQLGSGFRRAMLIAAALALGAVALFGFLEPRQGRYAQSYAGLIWQEFWTTGAKLEAQQPTEDLEAAFSLFAETTFVQRAAAGPGEGSASGADVVWIILETSGASDYELEQPAPDMPHVASLLPHAAIGTSHLSTSRSSIRADFALHTSIGDGPSAQSILPELRAARAAPLDSLAHILRREGYATRYYYPAEFMSADEEWMPDYLGFEHVESGTSIPMRLGRDERISNELEQFERVVADLGDCSASPRFIVVRSMIGHYPYLLDETASDRRQRRFGPARAVIDAGIGRLKEALQRCGRLDDAVIVIVGDHGPRLRVEEESLDLQFADRRSFHVPFIVHAKGAFPERRHISAVTSHLDLVPTMLDLLGLVDPQLQHQGLSILNPAIADRITPFYLSLTKADTAGSTGFHYRGRYYLYDEWNGVVLASDDFEFSAENILPPDHPRVEMVIRTVRALARVRASISLHLQR